MTPQGNPCELFPPARAPSTPSSYSPDPEGEEGAFHSPGGGQGLCDPPGSPLDPDSVSPPVEGKATRPMGPRPRAAPTFLGSSVAFKAGCVSQRCYLACLKKQNLVLPKAQTRNPVICDYTSGTFLVSPFLSIIKRLRDNFHVTLMIEPAEEEAHWHKYLLVPRGSRL